MGFPRFDRSRLRLRPLRERRHLIGAADLLSLESPVEAFDDSRLERLAGRVVQARGSRRAVILLMGAHVLRAGVSRYIIRLMEQGLLTHVAMNGAGAIHDYELALIGATTESVADYISTGEFGLWEETGRINDVEIGGQCRYSPYFAPTLR